MASKKAPPATVDVSGRLTLGEARVERRCLCEGCRACRGLPGYPCGAMADARPERCRWCS